MLTKGDQSTFGALLKHFRRRRQFTQQQLATAVGVHRNAIGRWERGDFLPKNRGMVLELARHLHLNELETRHLLEASLIAFPLLWSVPLLRNPFFTGREEALKILHAQLGTNQAVALTQSSALHGLGGIGKTQIALEYAYRYALEYSAVFWIRAETVESIISSLLRIAGVLQLPLQDHQDRQQVIAGVQRWLTTHRQWLLIWDNVEDLNLLDRFLPAARQGSIIITTRGRTPSTLAWGLELLSMEQEEGILFLLRRAKLLASEATSEQVRQFAVRIPTQHVAAAELVMAMEGLPLALDQAGAYLEETRCGLLAYLELFRNQRVVLLQQRGKEAHDHPASVYTTFTLALSAASESHPAVGDLLRVCALLRPNAIPEELFRQGAEYLGATLGATCRDPLEWNRVVAASCAYSLLFRQAEEQTLSLHRLVQAVLLDTMDKGEREQWVGRAIRALDTTFPEITLNSEGELWKQCERLLPHVLACAATISNQAADQNVVSVLRKAADYLREGAQYKQAEPLYERALTLCKQTLGSTHPLVSQTLNGLASLYVEQGQFEQAEALCQQALRIQEQTVSPHHSELASLLNTKADLYWRQGKYEQAESLLQQALYIGEQMLGLKHSQIAQPLTNLGLLYWKQGKYEQAKLLYQRALHIWEQLFGPEYHGLTYILTGLAIIYAEQRKYKHAEALFRRVLRIREQELGAEHYLVAVALSNLAELYADQEKYEQVEQLYQQAIRLCEQGVGSEHPSLAHSLYGLANLSCKQGKYEQAELLYQRALHIWEQALEYPETVTALSSLANLYLRQNRLEEAEMLCQRALAVHGQHLDQQTPEMAQTLHDLVILRQRQGNLREAVTLAERALSISSRSLGDTHPKTVAVRVLCAQLVQEQEDSNT